MYWNFRLQQNFLVFDGIELKKKYDKIIKFGIAFNEENCDIIYKINYGNCFKKKKCKKKYIQERITEMLLIVIVT